MKRNKQKRQAPPAPNKNPQTPVYSTVVVTPPRREINDIGTWKSALRSADIGIRWPLYDLYASILLDGQVTDAINKRIEAITDADIHFTADGKLIDRKMTYDEYRRRQAGEGNGRPGGLGRVRTAAGGHHVESVLGHHGGRVHVHSRI